MRECRLATDMINSILFYYSDHVHGYRLMIILMEPRTVSPGLDAIIGNGKDAYLVTTIKGKAIE